jgi:hypothetical protein
MFKNDVELLMMLSRGAPMGALGTDTRYSPILLAKGNGVTRHKIPVD